MKESLLIQQQFDAAKEAWKGERIGYQKRILELEGKKAKKGEKVTGVEVEPGLSAAQATALEARIQELTVENGDLETELVKVTKALEKAEKALEKKNGSAKK